MGTPAEEVALVRDHPPPLTDSYFNYANVDLVNSGTRPLNLAQTHLIDAASFRPVNQKWDYHDCELPKYLVSDYSAGWTLLLNVGARNIQKIRVQSASYALRKGSVKEGKKTPGAEFLVDVFVD